MNTYRLTYTVTSHNYYEVEADTEEEAMAKADKEGIWDIGTLVETDTYDEVFEEIEEAK